MICSHEPTMKKPKNVYLPSRPSISKLSGSSEEFSVQLAPIVAALEEQSEKRRAIIEKCINLRGKLVLQLIKLQLGKHEVCIEFESDVKELLISTEPLTQSLGIVDTIRDLAVQFITICQFNHFLLSGCLLEKSKFPDCIPDTDYLFGTIQFCHEIEEYGSGRALELDMISLELSKDILEQIHGSLMLFNFRNGPLRRRYDSVKYLLRNLENKIYSLSTIVEPTNELCQAQRVSAEEFKEMVERYDAYNDVRDEVIRLSRDPQRKAKKAIYALHRESKTEADEHLEQAFQSIKEIIEFRSTHSQHDVYTGAYASCLEEFVEAKLFRFWLGSGKLLSFQSVSSYVKDIKFQEYAGALVDFTGEMTRYCVKCATKHDVQKLQTSLGSLSIVRENLLKLQNSQQIIKLNKNISALEMNIEKVKRLLFEQRVLQRRNDTKFLHDSLTLEKPETNDEDE